MANPPASAKATALTVAQALAAILTDATLLASETVPIEEAHGRVLASALSARVTQPPFDASAMDGYAVKAADVAVLPARLLVIGEAAAGHAFGGVLKAGEAVRIFTGAPVPSGADAIVIQEDTSRDERVVIVDRGKPEPEHIRRRGYDFAVGDALLAAGRRLGAREIALAAAMGYGAVSVAKRPQVAVLSTGDELVHPGVMPGAGQIISSNHLGIAALARQAGAEVQLLGIACDTRQSLEEHIARATKADVLVTIGGASVGDHDLVGPVLADHGMAPSFWKIAMRPGKPLMFGRLGAQRVMGLPGNPVSSMVCARIFLVPLLRALQGIGIALEAPRKGRLTASIPANGPREHYMRATSALAADGRLDVSPVRSQDSSLLSPLAIADCFIVHPAGAPAAAAGADVDVLSLEM